MMLRAPKPPGIRSPRLGITAWFFLTMAMWAVYLCGLLVWGSLAFMYYTYKGVSMAVLWGFYRLTERRSL